MSCGHVGDASDSGELRHGCNYGYKRRRKALGEGFNASAHYEGARRPGGGLGAQRLAGFGGVLRKNTIQVALMQLSSLNLAARTKKQPITDLPDTNRQRGEAVCHVYSNGVSMTTSGIDEERGRECG